LFVAWDYYFQVWITVYFKALIFSTLSMELDERYEFSRYSENGTELSQYFPVRIFGIDAMVVGYPARASGKYVNPLNMSWYDFFRNWF
jgi:hypothetical protein